MTNLSASDLAGRRIREARQRRGWTVKELAELCAGAGAPRISATVITNLETRRHATREISLDEVLILARVLEVPPLQLIAPLNASERLEVMPGAELGAVEAVHWVGGDMPSYVLRWMGQERPNRVADTLGDAARVSADDPVDAVRLMGEAQRWLAWYDRLQQLNPETWKDPGSGIDKVISRLGDTYMYLCARLESLGYSPPPPPGEVAEILTRRGLPATVEDWREAARRPVEPPTRGGRGGDDDGEG